MRKKYFCMDIRRISYENNDVIRCIKKYSKELVVSMSQFKLDIHHL